MSEENDYSFVAPLFGWGCCDLDALKGYIEDAENWDVDISDINEKTIELFPENLMDINSWIFCTIDETFNAILSYIRENYDLTEKEEEALEKLENEFSPFINCMDSWFNNEIDEMDVSTDNKDEFVTELFKRIIEE